MRNILIDASLNTKRLKKRGGADLESGQCWWQCRPLYTAWRKWPSQPQWTPWTSLWHNLRPPRQTLWGLLLKVLPRMTWTALGLLAWQSKHSQVIVRIMINTTIITQSFIPGVKSSDYGSHWLGCPCCCQTSHSTSNNQDLCITETSICIIVQEGVWQSTIAHLVIGRLEGNRKDGVKMKSLM